MEWSDLLVCDATSLRYESRSEFRVFVVAPRRAGCQSSVLVAVDRLAPTSVVVDAHDPAGAQREDVEDLALERLAAHLADARAAGAQHDLLAAAGELERVHLAALLEPPAEGLDHLLAAVAHPAVERHLPGHVGIE